VANKAPPDSPVVIGSPVIGPAVVGEVMEGAARADAAAPGTVADRPPVAAAEPACNAGGGTLRRTGPSLSAASALLAADSVLAVAAWLLAVWFAEDSLPDGVWPGLGPLLIYPALFVLFLYALGLYRREAMLEPARALGLLPFAVGFAAASASLVVAVLPPPIGAAGAPALFGAAVVAFAVSGGWRGRCSRSRGAVARSAAACS